MSTSAINTLLFVHKLSATAVSDLLELSYARMINSLLFDHHLSASAVSDLLEQS